MKKLLAVLAGVSAVAMATPANASFVVTLGSTFGIPSNNDFQSDLNGLGYWNYTSTGASLTLTAPAILSFEFLGSESGFSDGFTAPGIAPIPGVDPEVSLLENHFAAPIFLGSGSYSAGSLAGLFNFTSNLGVPAGIGATGFGIFLPRLPAGTLTYTGDSLIFGFDDLGAGPDDNHDDYIVRVTAVPELGTWAMMLFGFGAMGMTIRRSRKTAIAQIA
jgi:hypothetical protein